MTTRPIDLPCWEEHHAGLLMLARFAPHLKLARERVATQVEVGQGSSPMVFLAQEPLRNGVLPPLSSRRRPPRQVCFLGRCTRKH